MTRNIAFTVVTLCSFLSSFAASSINIALPAIGNEFQLNAILLSWIATIFLLASSMFLIPFGKLGDMYGRKKVFAIGIAGFTIASFLCAISGNIIELYIFRVLQGITNSMIFATSLAILTSVFPPNMRGKILGINVATVYIGLSTGPVFGGLLTHYLGWRSIFWFNVPLGILIILVLHLKLKGEWKSIHQEKFDIPGSIIYSVTLVIMVTGFSLLPGIPGFALIATGIVFAFFFLMYENGIKDPILNVHLFKANRVFAMSNLAALINYSATFAVGFLLSLFLQYTKGLKPQEAGFILLFQPLTQAIFSPLAGRISDKIEPRIVSSTGMGLTTLGLFLMIFLNNETGYAYIVLCLLIIGIGLAFFSSPNTTAIMSTVETRHYGVTSATLSTMRTLGQIFSMGMAMLIFAVFIGNVRITPEYYAPFLKSIKFAFALFAFFCLTGVFASLARGRIHT